MHNNTAFNSVESAFNYLATRTTGFNLTLTHHEPTGNPKLMLVADDETETRLTIDPIATDLTDDNANYVITTYEHDDYWLVVYNNDTRPGARIQESDAHAETYIDTAMTFATAVERIADIARTYTDTPVSVTNANIKPDTPQPEPKTTAEPVGSSLDTEATLHFDGASRGNPGNAATGYVLSDDTHIISNGSPIGEKTNNEAEYRALIEGLETALEHDIESLTIHGDSKLIINQVTGKWDCNSDNLDSLYRRARSLLDEFDSYTIEHVPREHNHRADEAANTALDNAT